MIKKNAPKMHKMIKNIYTLKKIQNDKKVLLFLIPSNCFSSLISHSNLFYFTPPFKQTAEEKSLKCFGELIYVGIKNPCTCKFLWKIPPNKQVF